MNIKGFDKDLRCYGDYQFEIGGVYDTGAEDDELRLCSKTVFHYCKSLQNVHEHFKCNNEENRFCEIEVLGKEIGNGKKFGSNKIRIVREIVGEELALLKGLINGNAGLFNSGWNNSGSGNTGDWNTGDWNTGGRNTGDRNTGDWNSCNYSSGFFCSIEPKARVFNVDTDMTVSEFRNSKYYRALYSAPFILTEWIKDETKPEGGYLKRYTYKEACANWWSAMSDGNKKIIMSMSNFDKDIFKDITGIEV